MNPTKVVRSRVTRLTDLPNVGASIAGDLRGIGITKPSQLVGRDPLVLYQRLCRTTGVRHDPCVLDTFMSIVRFMDGEAAKPWWTFTAERKRRYGLTEPARVRR